MRGRETQGRLLYFCPLFTWNCSSESIPMKNFASHKGWLCRLNGSGWPGWPASYTTSVRWHPFIAPIAVVGRMHAQIRNNISESVHTNVWSILDPDLDRSCSHVSILLLASSKKHCQSMFLKLNKGSIWTSWILWVIYSRGGILQLLQWNQQKRAFACHLW